MTGQWKHGAQEQNTEETHNPFRPYPYSLSYSDHVCVSAGKLLWPAS